MRSEQEMREALRAWVRARAGDAWVAEITDHTPLFAQRALRSVHVPELLLLLERLRGAPIDVERLSPGDFRSIDTMVTRLGTAP